MNIDDLGMVPTAYQGLWRRSGIWRSNGSSDLTTQVWWFQSSRYHIDLRIPVDRTGTTGFAGVTLVDGDRCEWQPAIAFPAIGTELDAGWMRFDDGDHIHETGLDHTYEEDWYREPTGTMHGVRLEDPGSDQLAYLLISKRWMAWACGTPSKAVSTALTVYRHDEHWTAIASNLQQREQDATAGPVLAQVLQWQPGELIEISMAPGARWRVSAQ